MKVLITGGAGFIGVNTAKRFLKEGWEVVLFDNCRRRGVEHNLADLKRTGTYELVQNDVRDMAAVDACVRQHHTADLVIHLAAQVAVTTSVADPREDFDINALGTFNVLEALRLNKFAGLLVYSSTNKVYGGMENVKVVERNGRYAYRDLTGGVDETIPLDFHSPYGCSKGCADQYVRDYYRIYGLKTVVFRQSCIYGPHQFGIEDQGWVAWFTIAGVTGKPITIYGDGKQVRDVLFVEDLVDAYWIAFEQRMKIAGRVFNLGGGTDNQLSLLELIRVLEQELGIRFDCSFKDWRPGDQPVFVSDVSTAQRELNWRPKTGVKEGLHRLVAWVRDNKQLFD